MPRSIQDWLDQALRVLPPRYSAYAPLLAAAAGVMHEVETEGEELKDVVTIAGASGGFLTLMARGYGLSRTTDETDESLRERLRNVEEKLTRPAILDAVDRILALYTGDTATMQEWWEIEGNFCDVDAYADWGGTRAGGQFPGFWLYVPELSNPAFNPAFADAGAYADWAHAGDVEEHPAYAAIIAEVERTRAAGIPWLLIIADPV